MAKFELFRKLQTIDDAIDLLVLLTSDSERKKIIGLLKEFEAERAKLNTAIERHGKAKEIDKLRDEAAKLAEAALRKLDEAGRKADAIMHEATKALEAAEADRTEAAELKTSLKADRAVLAKERTAVDQVLQTKKAEMDAAISAAQREKDRAKKAWREAAESQSRLNENLDRLRTAASGL